MIKGRLILYEPDSESKLIPRELVRWTDSVEAEYERDGERWSHPYVPMMNTEDFDTLKKSLVEKFHLNSTLMNTDNYTNTSGVVLSIQRNSSIDPVVREISKNVMQIYDEFYMQKKEATMCRKSEQHIDNPSYELIVVPMKDVPNTIICHRYVQGTMYVLKTFYLFFMEPLSGIREATCLGRIVNLYCKSDHLVNKKELYEKLENAFFSMPKLAIRNWNARVTTSVIAPTAAPTHSQSVIPTSSDKWLSGLIKDVQRRQKNYYNDFRDALHYQTLTSAIFIYFACLCPIITFGGILSENTGKNIGTIESLVSGALCLVIFGLFSGQPMIIIGSTGPILVFETILYKFCRNYGIEYLNFRFCIGMWIFIIFVVLVITNGSNLVGYITRFTEDIFAALISIIYLLEAAKGLYKTYHKYPMKKYNETEQCRNSTNSNTDHVNKDTSNVFLMSAFLIFTTYFLANWMQRVQQLKLFPLHIRNFISNVAIILTIGIMTLLDYYFQIPTEKLQVPLQLIPTSPMRQNGSWFIHPIGPNKVWHSFAAVGPALLGSIIIFLDQQITAVIVNKISLIRKGSGYHLDLLVLAFLILITSAFGLPWFVAATVLSLNHVRSLQNSYPYPFIREQRVTEVLIGVSIGCTIVMAPILKLIPLAVLYGVFIIMGSSSLGTIEFMKRVKLLFIPAKDHREYRFMSHVPLRKIHFFTAIQIFSFGILMAVKSFQTTAILFPVMVLAMAFIRKLLERLFTDNELYWLDDLYYGKIPPHIYSFYELKLLDESIIEVKRGSIIQPDASVQIELSNNSNPAFVEDEISVRL